MLSEERMQELAEQFEERFSRVCLRILQDIGETLKKTGDLTPSQAKKLQQMFTYGADVQDMTKQLARAAGTSMEDIRKLYEQAAKEEQDWSKPFYDAKGVTQIPFAENELLQNIVKAAAAVTKGELRNMSRTTTVGIRTKNGFQPLVSFYKKTVDEAISAVATGTMDYNSTVRQAIKDMGSSGLRVQYESGYTRRLDSAIRQNIIDGVSYIAQETARQAGEEFGADGVELSAHSPCAPDHLPYQGKQYSLREYDDLQASLKRPIGEWNCRHFPYPVLLGISRPANSRAELAEMERESNRKIEIDGKEYTRYECAQLHRKLETKLRYAREEKAIYQAAGQADLLREATEKIRILWNKYKEVGEKAGLPTRAERMRIFAGKKADGTRTVVGKAAKQGTNDEVDILGIVKGVVSAATGKTEVYVNEFKDSLQGVKNEKVRKILEESVQRTVFETSYKKGSYHQKGKIYLSGFAPKSTVAHELFHEIDYTHGISASGYLSTCVRADYQRLQNIAAGYGGEIQDVLYSKYPEAFRKMKNGSIVFKEDYRGISDILNGMSDGEIRLGYGHDDDYWKKPLKLEKETWAQFGRTLYDGHDEVIEVLEYICPETYQKIIEKIKELG